MVDLFVKHENGAEAAVGVISFKADRLGLVLSLVRGIGLGEDQDVELTDLPIGMIAHVMTAFFVLDPDNKVGKLRVQNFSARNDAFFLTTTSSMGDVEYTNDLLFTKVGESYFGVFSTFTSANILDPIVKESKDWITKVRFVR
jgi:hypothetical protein